MLIFIKNSNFQRKLILIIGFFLGSGLLKAGEIKKSAKLAPRVWTVMSYNVENLFDTQHDEGKEDWTYLPLAEKQGEIRKQCSLTNKEGSRRKECEEFDWSESALQEKMKRLAQVILKSHGGKGPDLLVLAEVENKRVLDQLRTQYLKEAQYQSLVLLEGPDERGIDGAILSRWPIKGEPRLHTLTFSPEARDEQKKEIKTRGILEAQFLLPGGAVATVFAVHFPAAYHPFAQRKEAFETLNQLAAKAAQTSDLVLAGGDFNITHREDSRLYRAQGAPVWEVSHLLGCHSCLGSHYFEREQSWSFLDAIMLYRKDRSAPARYQILPESVRIVRELDIQTSLSGTPLGFQMGEQRGVSDHLPLALEIKEQK